MIGRLWLAGPRRSWVGALVALGVAAAFACLLPLGYSLTKQAMAAAIRTDVGNADLVLTPGSAPLPDMAVLEEVPGVAAVRSLVSWPTVMTAADRSQIVTLRAVEAGDWQALPPLQQGSGVSRDGIVLSSQAAQQLQAGVGDSVHLRWEDLGVAANEQLVTEVETTVVGIVASPAHFLHEFAPIYVDATSPGVAEQLARDTSFITNWADYAVEVEPGVETAQVEDSIMTTLSPNGETVDAGQFDSQELADVEASDVHYLPPGFQSVDILIDEQLTILGPLQLQVLLLGSAFLGLVWVTAVMVAGSALSLLVKRNRGELLLLRALGADQRQLYRPLAWGALAVGLAAGVSGLVTGHFLSLFFNVFIADFFGVSPAQMGNISTPLAVILPFALTLAAVPIAAFPPLRRLRLLDSSAPQGHRSPSYRWTRLALAAAAIVAGLALFRYIYASSVVVWNIQ
ncbi:ABC transporter permease [Buchananella hordeovulneris]|uniref:ABC transporter permease n=1 Tax=Buchananella hordeovulneris TaxID=52770 RepID=UPI0026DB5B45|nr:FtsX-like permease family protein [Buchananella hordeovulneris]MDO5079835.1 FtsX-like permease family protein [Buchananella hordeovulneris]